MKAKFGQTASNRVRLLFTEPNPNPFADNLSEFKEAGTIATQHGQQCPGVQRTIHATA